ncbi:hypothetical protein EL26_00670 [Tumebacillus flagellatus]|uniref:LXG domain-containing protein n=1 Tax=Tumebacillus flagellatus TaxID=1157490 RepID=A0A074LYM1_9BACL|nr:hypothetical protein EL26_00670 [Tumebacillus flagellatus]
MAQGQGGWKGDAARAFGISAEHLHEDYHTVSNTLDSAAGILNQLAVRMETVIRLRQQANQISQYLAHMRPETEEQWDSYREQQYQANSLRQQAESEANLIDGQAAQAIEKLMYFQNRLHFQHVTGFGSAASVALDGLPDSLRGYYMRHPEQLQDYIKPEEKVYSPQERHKNLMALARVMVYNLDVPDQLRGTKAEDDIIDYYIKDRFGDATDDQIERSVTHYFQVMDIMNKFETLKQQGKDITQEPDYPTYFLMMSNPEDFLPLKDGQEKKVSKKVLWPKKVPNGAETYYSYIMSRKSELPNIESTLDVRGSKLEKIPDERPPEMGQLEPNKPVTSGVERVGKIPSDFADRAKLEGHFDKHGKEFGDLYKNADVYLDGAREVIKNGIKVEYEYKGEKRTGYVRFMGTNKDGYAKFEFVGTNNNGEITTYHTQSGKKFWKTINGKNIPIINPVDIE